PQVGRSLPTFLAVRGYHPVNRLLCGTTAHGTGNHGALCLRYASLSEAYPFYTPFASAAVSTIAIESGRHCARGAATEWRRRGSRCAAFRIEQQGDRAGVGAPSVRILVVALLFGFARSDSM